MLIRRPKIPMTGLSHSCNSRAFLHSFNLASPDLNPEIIPNQVNYDLILLILITVASTNSFSSARALTASLDLDANANLSDEITSVIKFGGMYRYQTRSYNL